MSQLITRLKKVNYILDKNQKKVVILVLVLSIIGSFLEMLGVSVIVPLITVMLTPEIITENEYLSEVVFIQNASYETLVIFIGVGAIVLYVIKNLYFIFLSWVKVKCSCKIQRETAITMLDSYMSRGYQFFLDKNYGELERGVGADVNALYNFIYSCFRIMSEALTIILIIIYMCFADWQMAMAMILLSGFCLVLINFVFRRQMYLAGQESRKYSAKSGQAVLQALHGIKDVLVMQKQKYFIDIYTENKKKHHKSLVKQTVGGEIPAYIVEGVCVAGLLGVVCYRIMAEGNSVAFIAVLASFAVGAFRILPSLGKISSALNTATTSWPSVESLYSNIMKARNIQNRRPIEDNVNVGFYNSIKINDMSFAYNKEQKEVLQNTSVEIKKGESIALIGESGAGKSTLADIILGLLIPQKGSITIDGIDVHTIPNAWAKLIGYVPQSVFLADASIMQNIAYGEHKIDVDRVWEVVEKARLTAFIKELPNGLETVVGDRGVRLSGGQRQRIAIARALYHEPEIMVLDEATSALDNDTEQAVMEAIDSLQGQTTLIIIAHRLTTVKNCDKIYEIQNGKINLKDKEVVLS